MKCQVFFKDFLRSRLLVSETRAPLGARLNDRFELTAHVDIKGEKGFFGNPD